MNGERLLQLSKSSTQIEYETSTGNTFVTAYISGEIVKYFKVRYPNGVIGIFGFTTNTASKLAYPITKLTDAIGINISFSYIEDSNTYYIDKIRYGGRGEIGEAGYMSDFAKLQFIYTDNRIDVISQYVVDKTVKMTKILDKIECYANSEVTPEKTYDINYINTDNRIQNSPPTGVSQLMKISCTANKELNSLKFIYGENVSPAITKTENSFTGQSFDLKNTNALIGNFHDKNRNDALIVYPKAEIYQQGAHYDYTPVYPADKEIKIYNIQNEQLSTVTPLTTGAGFLSLLTIDVDNDGLDEVVKINTSGNVANNEVVSYSIYKPDESFGLSLQRTETKNYNIYISESYFDYSNYDWVDIYSIDSKKFYVGNFSGNGKSEILCVSGTNNVSIISFENSINVIYSNQNLFNHISNLIYPLDIDGDGQTEVLVIGNTKTDVYKYKSGAGFQDIADWALTSSEFSERQIMFADLNEDGNIDIVKSPQQNTVDVEYETRKA
ncbi:MAG: VCBS repeat-containing protein, partial [Ignavibacteria bacterium]|nr:VCBS repeat-containing protein [Ignavibacteria bacterium]